MSRLVVHIGLPKTGTTTLQEALFKRHPQVRPFVKKGTKHLLADDTRRFRENCRLIQKIFEPEHGDTRCTIISDEILSFGEYSPLRQRSWRLLIPSDHEQLAQRIRAAFDDPLVLVVVREQLSFLVSFYAQMMKTEGLRAYPSDGIERWIESAIENAPYRSICNLLKYDELYEAYVNELGLSRVALVYFEDMVADPERFAHTLSDILKIDPNWTASLLRGEYYNQSTTSFRRPWLGAIRKASYLRPWKIINTPRLRCWLHGVATVRGPRVSGEMEQRVADCFRPHNRLLEQMTGKPLREIGYPI